MQSILSYALLAGLGTELVLAFGLIFFIMRKSKIPNCLQRKLLPLPVCQSDKCRQLETVMLDYMEKELDFKDTSTELAAVYHSVEGAGGAHPQQRLSGIETKIADAVSPHHPGQPS